MHLVLIETAGNQAYIFATNKLRENVGASELTYRVGTEFTLDAVAHAGGPTLKRASTPGLRQALQDHQQNPPLESSPFSVEVILAASGKALLLVRDRDIGRKIVKAVSGRTLRDAPGIDAPGTIGEGFDVASKPIQAAIREAHRSLEKTRSAIPGPAQRFLRLPIVAECRTSGLPAASYQTHDLPEEERGPRSAVSLSKQWARHGWHERVEALRIENQVEHPLTAATTELEKLGCEWVAVIHADGNGLGQVFLKFDRGFTPSFEQDPREHNRKYINELRRFSLALDECTDRAFCIALQELRPARKEENGRKVLPIVPLVLGGDDLTVVCDGRQAMRFTRAFLRAFEDLTGANDTIRSVMQRVSGQDRVTSCAGVAIVKPHFPFFAAYSLAEDLLDKAKEFAKGEVRPFSAVDFHVLYDASARDLKRLRRSLTVEVGGEKARLFARPYAVSTGRGPAERRIDTLESRIGLIRSPDEDGRRRLPNSMLHELREGLFLGRREADSRLRLALGRRDAVDFGDLIRRRDGDSWSLFFEEEPPNCYAGLLDAMDLAEFWEGVNP